MGTGGQMVLDRVLSLPLGEVSFRATLYIFFLVVRKKQGWEKAS